LENDEIINLNSPKDKIQKVLPAYGINDKAAQNYVKKKKRAFRRHYKDRRHKKFQIFLKKIPLEIYGV
jgi:hypothetical protein